MFEISKKRAFLGGPEGSLAMIFDVMRPRAGLFSVGDQVIWVMCMAPSALFRCS